MDTLLLLFQYFMILYVLYDTLFLLYDTLCKFTVHTEIKEFLEYSRIWIKAKLKSQDVNIFKYKSLFKNLLLPLEYQILLHFTSTLVNDNFQLLLFQNKIFLSCWKMKFYLILCLNKNEVLLTKNPMPKGFS